MDSEERNVEKLLRQQATVSKFGGFALRQNKPLEILNEATRACAEGLMAPFCKILRFRLGESDLLVEAGCGWKSGVVGSSVLSADRRTPAGRALSAGLPSICNDLHRAIDLELPEFYAAHGIISTIDVVIPGDNRPYGVLEISSDVARDFDRYDINFLVSLASLLAEAIAASARTALLQTTIEDMEASLQQKDRLLNQKKILTEEFQHRVRNNLHFVYGMLAQQLDNPKMTKRVVGGIARRVFTLAQVYEHLRGEDFARTTDFGQYVRSLCHDLAEIHAPRGSHRTLEYRCDPLDLDLDIVTALGIVITELVTNSFDHAFPEGKGAVFVSVRRPRSGNEATIVISDNGIGFRPDPESKRHGIGLVFRLIEQAGATATVDTDHGTAWRITLPVVNARTPEHCL